jgi:hypothetical protein
MVNKPKPESQSSLRTPGPKKKLGLVVPPALRMPHQDLITQRQEETQSLLESMPSQTTMPSLTRRTRHSNENASAIAPQRDFMRAANSIVREVVSGGHFKGKSKQLYDCLYLLTRGAVVPSRKVRISRPKLMTKAHIGSRVTFDANISHLKAIGLIRVVNITGEHEGNEYEVLLPEEISMPSQSSQSSQTGYAQKVDILDSLESSQPSHSSSSIETDTSESPKTSFKTKEQNTDDDATALALLRELERELTGKESSSANWKPLFELLIAEARIAAARTGQVSSVPAFLAEHLRRRLWKEDKKATESREASAPEGLATQPSNVKDCPDCGGSGLYYPDGYEKGVAKCRHEKLNREGA